MFQNDYIAGICGAIKTEKEFNLLTTLYDTQYRAGDIDSLLGRDPSRVLTSFYDVALIVPLFFPTKPKKLMANDDKSRRSIRVPMVTHLGRSVVEGFYNFIETGEDFSSICKDLYENRILLKEPPELKAKKKSKLKKLTLEYEELRTKYVSDKYRYDLSMDESHDQKLAVNDELMGLGQGSDYQDRYPDLSVYTALTSDKLKKLKDPEIQKNITKLISAISRKSPSPLQLIIEHNLEHKVAKRKEIFELVGKYKDAPGKHYESIEWVFETGFCALLNIDGEEYFEITPIGYDLMEMMQDIEKLHNSPWYQSIDKTIKNMPAQVSSDVFERSELIITYLKFELAETLSRMKLEKSDEDNNISILNSFSLIRDITLNDIENVDPLSSINGRYYSTTMEITLKCKEGKNECTESDYCKDGFKSHLLKSHNNIEVLDIHPVQDSANPLRCKLKVKFVPKVQSFITANKVEEVVDKIKK